MDENKQLFKQILSTTILRKHRNKMKDLEHFYRKRNVGVAKLPIEEYGIKWTGGSIMLRRYTSEDRVEIFGNIEAHFDSFEIYYYEANSNDFITANKELIKEMIRELEGAYNLNSNEV